MKPHSATIFVIISIIITWSLIITKLITLDTGLILFILLLIYQQLSFKA